MKARKRNRKKGYNYARENFYYVTICVKGKHPYFGKILDHKMILNQNGKIAEEEWLDLEKKYPYVILHEFVVMPDHFHGILEINGKETSPDLKIKSLSELVGAFKTLVSKRIHKLDHEDFKWHRSFHDHIIQDEDAFRRISDYIRNNPRKWMKK